MANIQGLDLRSMLRQFGVVTVMDVDVYNACRDVEGEWDAKATFAASKLFSLKTLKIANINTEGPTKQATGGQNADVLLKYGKTFTIEMQDALGSYDVLEHVYGANSNGSDIVAANIVTITDRFPGELTLVGKTFVIDKATGAKQPMYIVIPFYLGDGIFNLTQDAEGDVSVFDMNGNILRFSTGVGTAATIANDQSETRGELYGKGSDNEFYFFATEAAAQALLGAGVSYEQLWSGAELKDLVLDYPDQPNKMIKIAVREAAGGKPAITYPLPKVAGKEWQIGARAATSDEDREVRAGDYGDNDVVVAKLA